MLRTALHALLHLTDGGTRPSMDGGTARDRGADPGPGRRVLAGLPVALLAAACAGDTGTPPGITTLSSRPDMVTGGDALVRIDAPGGGSVEGANVTVNGTDVTGDFRPTPDGAGLMGLVTGLRPGPNTLAVTTGGGAAEVTLVNHPAAGPVFSGPHETPFLCQTEEFTLVTGELLGPPLDANCSVARRVDYVYRSTADGELKPLTDRGSYPGDLARTTISTGAEVPYILRVETGTANRGVYELAMLHDPVSEPDPSPWSRPAGWNHRVVFTLGGGCPGGWYVQGARTAGVTNDFYLHQGYAVVSNSLNVFGNNCNELLAAETAALTKERFVEAFGPPLFTIATGASGGSYQTFHAIDNYPGIFDGGIPGSTYPDVQFATTPWNSDGRLLLRYFETKAGVPWTDEEERAASGFTNHDFIGRIGREPGGHSQRIHVGEACRLPEEMRYHPVTNPGGARCEIFEHSAGIYGRNPETGFVRRPIDNVGVQYGLGALNDGAISKAQFLDLNEKIGGFDLDGNVAPERTVGDTAAMRIAYETGLLLNGGGGLAYTPIIEFRGYADDNAGADDHPRFMSFSTKARLLKANGHRDTFVMWTVDDDEYGRFSTNDPVLHEAFRQMDAWLTALVTDTSDASPLEKARRARPAGLTDACWTRFPERRKIEEEQTGTEVASRCQELYPSGSFARGVAGSDITTDIIKCQMKPIDPADYRVEFTPAEMERLQAIFPDGVCDWSQPGVSQRDPLGPWYVVPGTPRAM
jgi:hypothetical protein